MNLAIRKQVGNEIYQFEFEGKDLFDVLMESQKVAIWNIEKCGLCESTFLRLYAYETKEDKYQYIKVTCGKCKGSLTLGKRKDNGAYFYRKKEDGSLDWQAYTPSE